jgi:hypothetical protein
VQWLANPVVVPALQKEGVVPALQKEGVVPALQKEGVVFFWDDFVTVLFEAMLQQCLFLDSFQVSVALTTTH